MKSLTSVLGWTLLVAVLAVPSFLFYNWWNKSRQQAVAEMAQEPVQNIFPAQEKTAPPPAAQAPAQQAAVQPVLKAQAPSVQPKPQPAQEPAAKPAQEPSASAQAPAPVSPPVPAVSSAPAQAVQQSTAAAVGDGQKSVSAFKPKTDRDPTLSPDDYQRIRDAEAARLEAERQARMAERNRPKAPDITSRLQLQGIVGNAAIINGEMYAVGQSVYGAKIVKVGTNYIIVEHKGKKYRKVIQ